MYKITKKDGCTSAFKLKDKRVFVFEVGVAVELSDDDWKAILAEYSSFILPRIWSESNLDGCFLVVRVDETPIVVEEPVKVETKKKTKGKK